MLEGCGHRWTWSLRGLAGKSSFPPHGTTSQPPGRPGQLCNFSFSQGSRARRMSRKRVFSFSGKHSTSQSTCRRGRWMIILRNLPKRCEKHLQSLGKPKNWGTGDFFLFSFVLAEEEGSTGRHRWCRWCH